MSTTWAVLLAGGVLGETGCAFSEFADAALLKMTRAARPEDLMVMRVGDVGWSDLGAPNRVLSTLARIGVESELAVSAS